MRRHLFALVAAALLAPIGLSGEVAPGFSETVSVGYVMVPFTALGVRGVPITDLRQKEVQLLVDGQPVRTDMFERSMNAPVSFSILFDGSGSMGLAGKKEAARAALSTLFAHRIPGDDFAFFVFDDQHATQVVPPTADAEAILRAFDQVKPFGKTAFFDALATMPQQSDLGSNPTRAIILLSDGIDNASHLTRSGLEAALQGVSIPIYPLGLRAAGEYPQPAGTTTSEELSDLQLLDEIANITGGRLFVGNEPAELSHAVETIEGNLRAQYLIGFAPTGKGTVRYHSISLKLDGRARSVRVRSGYNGTEPPIAVTTKQERKKS